MFLKGTYIIDAAKLTHINISNVNIKFSTIGTQQKSKHGAQESDSLKTGCQHIQTVNCSFMTPKLHSHLKRW